MRCIAGTLLTCVLLTAFIKYGLAAAPQALSGTPAAPTLPSLVVLGVGCDAKNDEWRAGLVGFGVDTWLAQSFYDSGQFHMFDERPDVLEAVRAQSGDAFDQAKHKHTDTLASIAKTLSVDLVAVGKVSAYYPLGQQLSIGPFHSLTRDTFIKVDVCLYDSRSGNVAFTTGSGKIERKGQSFAADYSGGKLPFDASTVAPATEEAVESAVAHLVPSFHPHARHDALIALSSPIVVGVLPLGLQTSIAAQYPELKDKRVAFGIHNRISRAISDTKLCSLQEMDSEVLDALTLQWWIASTGAPPTDDARSKAPSLSSHVNYLVYGEVCSFSIAHVEHVAALSGSVADKVTIGIQLRAVDPTSSDSGYIVASGTGVASGDWEAWKGNPTEFEQSFIGRAATAAVDNAWPTLLSDLAAREKAKH